MGFLGFGNYSKPGKGVNKDEPQKKRFFYFFELYFRKFWGLIKLNLLFVLTSLPIVTIGASLSAMSYILRNYNDEKPIFLWADYMKSFKQNFKVSTIVWLIDVVLIFLLVQSYFFYSAAVETSWFYYIPLAFIMFFGIVVIFSNFYIYLLIASVNLKLKGLIKNAVYLSFLGVKTNVITLIIFSAFAIAIFYFGVLFLPFLPFALVLLPVFSTIGFIIVYNSFQYIYKFIAKPYYEETGEKDPYIKEENTQDLIFDDDVKSHNMDE
ncbi:MAG: DUF624 domain-containing protein [Oscillospiraceae bacterium]